MTVLAPGTRFASADSLPDLCRHCWRKRGEHGATEACAPRVA